MKPLSSIAWREKGQPSNMGKLQKQNESKFDFEYKSVPQIQSNAKITQKASEITTTSLWLNKKTCIKFYHYNPPREKTYKEVFSEKTYKEVFSEKTYKEIFSFNRS